MKFERPFLQLPRRYCAETMAREIADLGPAAWVPHPGKLPGNDALLLITAHGEMTNSFTGPMQPTEYLRRCPYIMEIMADIGGVWGRSRLMGLAPSADVPLHIDLKYYWRTHFRIHVPIVTTPQVQFTCDGETVHMAPGECWTFDSFRPHKVHNGGRDKRIHLVLDTVGGDGFWDLVDQASQGVPPPEEPLAPGSRSTSDLMFENVNTPSIMSPWEIRCHIDFVMRQAPKSAAIQPIAQRLNRFADSWTSLWARFGPSDAGNADYLALLQQVRTDLRMLGAGNVMLPNSAPLDTTLAELIFIVAVPSVRPASIGQRLPAGAPQRLAS